MQRAPSHFAPLLITHSRFSGMPKRSLLPADGGDCGLFSGDARADLFDNDLSDLLGKSFGNFHILQHMARFGNGIRGGWNLGGDDGFKHDRDHLAGFSSLAVHAVDFLERNLGGDFDVGSRLSDRGEPSLAVS